MINTLYIAIDHLTISKVTIVNKINMNCSSSSSIISNSCSSRTCTDTAATQFAKFGAKMSSRGQIHKEVVDEYQNTNRYIMRTDKLMKSQKLSSNCSQNAISNRTSQTIKYCLLTLLFTHTDEEVVDKYQTVHNVDNDK